MSNKRRLRSLRFWFVVWALAAAADAGCSSRPPQNAPVDADRARATLRTALDSWKQGDKADGLQSASPPIYVIDMDWKAGTRLKDYQVMGDGEEKDAHLFSRVKLTLVGPGGRETSRDVTYIISTAPNLTVARKVF